MFSKLADLLGLLGLASIIAGFYLWLGLPAALIILGFVLIFIGYKIPEVEK